MIYTVYILYSLKDKKLYVGCASDLVERLLRHNNGQVIATKNRRPLSLIYQELLSNKGEAFQRERFLKSLWGARLKKKVLNDFLKSQNQNVGISNG